MGSNAGVATLVFMVLIKSAPALSVLFRCEKSMPQLLLRLIMEAQYARPLALSLSM